MPLRFNIFKRNSPPSKEQCFAKESSSGARSYHPSWSSPKQIDDDAFIRTSTKRATTMARIQNAFKGRPQDSGDAKPVPRMKRASRTTQSDFGSVGRPTSPELIPSAGDFASIPRRQGRPLSASPRRLAKVPGSADWWATLMEERDAPKRLERIMSDPEFSVKMMRTAPCDSDAHTEVEPHLPLAITVSKEDNMVGAADSGDEAETCANSSSDESGLDNCDIVSRTPRAPEESILCSDDNVDVASAVDIPQRAELNVPCVVQDVDVAVVNVIECSQAGVETHEFVPGVEILVPVSNGSVDDAEVVPELSQAVFVDDSCGGAVEPIGLEVVPDDEPVKSISVGDLGHQEPRKDLQALCRLSVVQQRLAKRNDKTQKPEAL